MVLGVLGINVIRECCQEHFCQHGPLLFELPPVVYASPSWQQALQYCHKTQEMPLEIAKGLAEVRGHKPVLITVRTVKILATTSLNCQFCELNAAVLIELLSNANALPNGFLVSPSLIMIVRGTAYVLACASCECWSYMCLFIPS